MRGSCSLNLDAKGRIAIPTRYRQGLEESCERQLIVTLAANENIRGIKGCLWIYPLHEWEKLENAIDKHSSSSKMVIRFQRFLLGNAHECEMDKQGRVPIPEYLRSLVGMGTSYTLKGVGKKFELWNKDVLEESFDDFMSQSQDDDDEEKVDLPF